ncbi:hypothetical protein J2X52_001946 [Luteimonas sp. 3794]|nr:hypothetical protein [Luteimonas sp. 3794]
MTEMIPRQVPAVRPYDGDGELIGLSAPRPWMQPT